ncbi:phosphoenolpyruvate carboxylase [bacterium]|nr:phosphoenolpyruvate carboxylase [bacterium]
MLNYADRIVDQYQHLLGVLSDILDGLGRHDESRILKEIGLTQVSTEIVDYSGNAVSVLSMAFQLLNVVEQTVSFEDRSLQFEKNPAVSGTFAQAIRQLRDSGLSWQGVWDAFEAVELDEVFTAHPTESRRESMVHQLARIFLALKADVDSTKRERMVRQAVTLLVATGEFIREKPTVDSERAVIGQILSRSLPEAVPMLMTEIRRQAALLGCPDGDLPLISQLPRIRFRDWVGCDRDGHRYVTVEETRKTMLANRKTALSIHRSALNGLIDLLSVSRHEVHISDEFEGKLLVLTDRMSAHLPTESTVWKDEPFRLMAACIAARIPPDPSPIFGSEIRSHHYRLPDEMISDLAFLRRGIVESRLPVLLDELDNALLNVSVFGFHFRQHDIRQNSAAYEEAFRQILNAKGIEPAVYFALPEPMRCDQLKKWIDSWEPAILSGLEYESSDVLGSISLLTDYAKAYGRDGSGLLIVSLTRSQADLLTVAAIAKLAGGVLADGGLVAPVVPLFETEADHQNAVHICDVLFHPLLVATATAIRDRDRAARRALLAADGREDSSVSMSLPIVTVMNGHSDGGKDAGIFRNFLRMARTRAETARLIQNRGFDVGFFEGVGGTTFRGAGPTGKLLDAILPGLNVRRFQITEQGQVIAQKHLMPFMSELTIEGLVSALVSAGKQPLDIPVFLELVAENASRLYRELISDSEFVRYFTESTVYDCLDHLRMGSRPGKRGGLGTIADMRAIPFVLCQSQSRINFTGWFGVGTALAELAENELASFNQLKRLVKSHPTIKFIFLNIEMALKSASLEWMTRYSELVADAGVRHRVLSKLRSEFSLTEVMLGQVFDSSFEQRRPRLAHTIALRKPMLDVLHQIQINVIRQWRDAVAGGDPKADGYLDLIAKVTAAIANGIRGTG